MESDGPALGFHFSTLSSFSMSKAKKQDGAGSCLYSIVGSPAEIEREGPPGLGGGWGGGQSTRRKEHREVIGVSEFLEFGEKRRKLVPK